MRAVIDTNVLVSAVVAQGAPQVVLRRWHEGAFELVVSERLIEELTRALAYAKVRARVRTDEAGRLVGLLRGSAMIAQDPERPPRVTSRAPKGDHRIALAASTRSILVTGDRDLLALAGSLPVESPRARAFLDRLPSDG